MKIHITNYSFNASTGAITFNDYAPTPGIALNNVLLITNSTVGNTIIYNFAVPGLGGTVSGNTLTLTYNTLAAGMNNTDKLVIYYDDANAQAKDATLQLLQSQNDYLRKMVKLLESGGTVDINNRQRVVLEGGASSQVTASIVAIAANSNVASGLSAQSGNSFPDSTNPYTLTSRAALVVAEFPVGQEWRVADSARNTFATGIRTRIT